MLYHEILNMSWGFSSKMDIAKKHKMAKNEMLSFALGFSSRVDIVENVILMKNTKT